jgi:phage-related tail protein
MASPRDLQLRVILQAVDKAGSVLRGISGNSSAAAKSLKAARDQLKELDRAQGTVQGFRTATAHLRQQERALRELQGKAETYTKGLEAQRKAHENIKAAHKVAKRDYEQLASALADGKGQGGEFTRQMELARIRLLSSQQAIERSLSSLNSYKTRLRNVTDETDRLTARQKTTQDQLDGYKRRLDQAGISTTGLAGKARALRAEEARLNDTMAEQKRRLEALAPAQKRLDAARHAYEHAPHKIHDTMFKGALMAGTGGGVLRGMHGPVDEAKAYGTEVARIGALGMGVSTTADAEKFAAGMKTYGTSRRDNLGLMRDAMSVFGDEHEAQMVAPTLARMKFANAAVFGSEAGAENERKFMDMLKVIELRGGLASKEAFQGQADKIQRVIAATGGRVQGEEWLNVIKTGGVAAKGLSDEALYYQMEPLVQEMGGHRVGTALMSAYQNVYQGHTTKRAAMLMDKLGLIGDRSKVDHDKSGQIAHLSPGALKGSELFRTNQFEWMEQVLLPALAKKGITDSQRIMDTMGGIFSNRTASGMFAQMYQQRLQIRKNEKLNRGADGIDQLYERGRNTAGGAELELAARKADAYRALGDTVMPAYTKALELAAGALQGLTNWMQAHPTLARAMAYTLGGLAVVLTLIGGALLAIGPGLLMWAALRLALAQFGIAAPSAIGLLRGLGTGVLWLGRALVMNPIGATIAAIAVAGTLIYSNWDAIVAWLDRLPERFSNLGLQITLGLSRGLTSGMTWVRDTISGMADNVVTWFKDKLGIRSPSRVFIAAGGEISAGAALGIAARQPLVRRAALAMAATATSVLPLTAAAGGALSVEGGAGLQVDRRPPLAAPAGAGAPVVMNLNIHPGAIVVNAVAGMDERALARLVGEEIDRRARAQAATLRSSLRDND